MQTPNIQPWKHWANMKQKRIFLVVDVHLQHIVMLEVKEYAPAAERDFIYMPLSDFVTLTEETMQLVAYTPKLS